LPLHIIAQSPYKTSQMMSAANPFRALSFILQLNKNAARISDAKGDVPLSLALRSCKQWNEGIDQLVHAFPGALTMMDGEFGFYPFMIAASMEGKLCSVYNMLRACPELERFGLE